MGASRLQGGLVMHWKIILAATLITAIGVGFKIQSARMETLAFERDLLQQHLNSERAATLTLTQELAERHQQMARQRVLAEQAARAANASAQRLREIEARHAQANRTLEELRRQNEELAAWSDAAVPDAAVDWLREVTGRTGTPSSDQDRDRVSATPTQRANAPDQQARSSSNDYPSNPAATDRRLSPPAAARKLRPQTDTGTLAR